MMTRYAICLIVLGSILTCRPIVNYTTYKMVLAPIGSAPTQDEAALFHDLFCAVMKSQASSWGDCNKYLEPAKDALNLAATDLDLSRFPLPSDKYEVLIVPGMFASCVSDVSTLENAAKRLHDSYGLVVKILGPDDNFSSFSSSEANEAIIQNVIEQEYRVHHLPFILVGHSKGATDAMVFLADSDQAKGDAQTKVAALVSLAGVIGGSRFVDVIKNNKLNLLSVVTELIRSLGRCEPGYVPTDLAGLESLSRSVRLAFLQSLIDRHQHFRSRMYSVVAISDETTTSTQLRGSWDELAVYERDQDGLMIRYDAILPGATYLGAALADHLTIAMPIRDSKHWWLRERMDRNNYPRSILLEAIIRFVIHDLSKEHQKGRVEACATLVCSSATLSNR